MSKFWSEWIVILTVASLIICYGLVWWGVKHNDHPTEADNIPHASPDVCVAHHPVPSLWLYLFYLSILFVMVYFSLYPALGLLPGALQWTSQRQYIQEYGLYHAQYAEKMDQYLSSPIPEVARNPVARQIGKRLFLTYCSNCHQPGGKEYALHYPIFADQDWLWGGEPEQIRETIIKGRTGMMPGWGSALGEKGISEIANYVMTLSGRQPMNQDEVVAGQEKFKLYCYFCHGLDGKGDIRVGGPNLTDQIWLHITPREAETDLGLSMGIKEAISNGFTNVMPPHGNILDRARIHMLTGYVYGLSN